MRTLYHLIWGHPSINKSALFVPRVPRNILEHEDKSINRLCSAPSVDDCLTGIGISNIGRNFLLELLSKDKDHVDSDKALFPFTVIRFSVDQQSPDVLSPANILKYVPDASLTNEHWITVPIVPESVSQRWLVGGSIIFRDICLLGEKRKYFMITDSQWSDESMFAEPDFVQEILNVTKTYLLQYHEELPKVSKSSLNPQIGFAESVKDVSGIATGKINE